MVATRQRPQIRWIIGTLILQILVFHIQRNLSTADVLLSTIRQKEQQNHQTALSSSLCRNSTSNFYEGEVRAPPIPLLDLIHTKVSSSEKCEDIVVTNWNTNLTEIRSTILPESITNYPPRKIPRIIHLTSRSKCTMAKVKEATIDKWRSLTNHSLYFHDDDAMEALLQRDWPEFPYLKMIQKCLVSGAAKADLWRLLVLWEYGGIYSDTDTAPGELFLNDNTSNPVIGPDDEAFFVIEAEGFLSQYFMAAAPKHPLIYLTIVQILERLLAVENIKEQYVPFVTGPGALKAAFVDFMGRGNTDGKPPAGVYQGSQSVGNGLHTVTVKGDRRTASRRYVVRQGIDHHTKVAAYKAVGMSHFNEVKKDNTVVNSSCKAHLYNSMYG